MTGSVMETTAVVGVTGESSSSSFSDPQQSSRCVVVVDILRGAIDVMTIDGQMTMTRDAVVVTGSKTFEELCEGVRREMRPRRRRPRPPTPMEDEARASSSSSSLSSLDDYNRASIVANESGGEGEGEDGTMANGVLLLTTATMTTGPMGVDRADRSATMQQRLPPQTMTTTSAKLRRKLGSVMAKAIACADGRLMDMECEMDELSLVVGVYGGNDNDDVEGNDDEGLIARGMPMQQFGDRVDEIVDALSSTFLAFVEENGDVMTESDQAWAEGEYATFFHRSPHVVSHS
jgi:hypothetical protein